ncbi:MAG: hypothetical protein HC916_14635 [Coleofasciculaceae cyanobacterium SM2_1_6]|nr:hypothetical protein [Coleofasciculaceae cyanobacterium SM2_1_6]
MKATEVITEIINYCHYPRGDRRDAHRRDTQGDFLKIDISGTIESKLNKSQLIAVLNDFIRPRRARLSTKRHLI